MEVPLGRSTCYLDELVLHNIVDSLETDIPALASAVAVSKSFSAAAQDVASEGLLALLKRQQVLPRRLEDGAGASRVAQLRTWAAVDAATVLTLRADPSALHFSTPPRASLYSPTDVEATRRVTRMDDLSGRGHHASAFSSERCPLFVPDAIAPGVGALDFNGKSILQTAPFIKALPQPVSLVVVARCRGDTTLCDALTPTSARFELCHGYPAATADSPGNPAVCISANGVGNSAPSQLLRGSTRSTDTWHVYTAIFDGDKSEMYVDGVREASGRSCGTSELDGLRLGCDHTQMFFLKGSVAELRLYSCHLADGPRSQMEAALALRYGLTPAADKPATPQKRSRRLSRSRSA